MGQSLTPEVKPLPRTCELFLHRSPVPHRSPGQDTSLGPSKTSPIIFPIFHRQDTVGGEKFQVSQELKQ